MLQCHAVKDNGPIIISNSRKSVLLVRNQRRKQFCMNFFQPNVWESTSMLNVVTIFCASEIRNYILHSMSSPYYIFSTLFFKQQIYSTYNDLTLTL